MVAHFTQTGLVVLADDRTGALETAGMCADLIGAVAVHVATSVPVGRWPHVVDMATRHRSPEDAAATVTRLTALPRGAAWMLKMDSTLRGNWAAESIALTRASGRPGLVVASFPALGRTCAGGEVLVDSVPVHLSAAGHDARRAITSSRPREHLLDAGAGSVTEIDGGAGLRDWLRSPSTEFAVCDAEHACDLVEIGRAWAAHAPVSYIGTAAGISAAIGALDGVRVPSLAPPLPEHVLVVCGSLHPMARAQIANLRQRGVDVHWPGASWSAIEHDLRRGLAVVCSHDADGPVSGDDADRVAATLAACVQPIVTRASPSRVAPPPIAPPSLAPPSRVAQPSLTPPSHAPPSRVAQPSLGPSAGNAPGREGPGVSHRAASLGLFIIGGDTAAAVLGDRAVVVGGTLVPGVPWAPHPDQADVLIMTRAGGFGTVSSLAELLWDRLPS